MPKTLLLADDSVTIQKVVGISFANEDVVLLTVDNGDDAIARAREAGPDLVLADVVMPGKNGYEVCEAIKSDPELQHIPVLLLTGTFEPFDEERAAQVRADGHITKPFEAQALVDQVNRLLAQRAQATAAAAEPEPAPAPPEAPQAYDFFEDEVSDGMSSPREPSADTLAEPLELDEDAGSEPLELEATVEDDFGAGPVTQTQVVRPPPPPPASSIPRASTPSVEAEPARDPLGDSDFTSMGLEPALDATPTEPPRVAPPPPPPPEPAAWNDVTGGGPFDLGFMGSQSGDDPLADIGSEGFSSEGRLDPAAARAHEVSSSDLGATTPPSRHGSAAADSARSAPPPPPAAPPPAFRAPEPVTPAPDPFEDVPLAVPAPFDSLGTGSAPEPSAMLESEPVAETVVEEPALAEPLETEIAAHVEPAAASEPAAPRTPSAPPMRLAAPSTPSQPPAAARPSSAAISPSAPISPSTPKPVSEPPSSTSEPPAAMSSALREGVHESIEKVAWEAFGDVSERIVREVVERIESVAWEVIPQMAESLIREEIQRLKDEDPSSS